ncbi:MAG: PqqD family protein [Desulfobacca sp.]|nr:PqqD family protein [Desulfobacca sp.]
MDVSSYEGKVCRFKARDKEEQSSRMVFVEGRCGSQITPAQIIDKRAKDGNHHYYLLNDTAAFITSLVFQHIPVNLVTEAYMARFGLKDRGQAEKDIRDWLEKLRNQLDCVYLKDLEVIRYEPPDLSPPIRFSENLYLHFDVEHNQMGGVGIKIPPT